MVMVGCVLILICWCRVVVFFLLCGCCSCLMVFVWLRRLMRLFVICVCGWLVRLVCLNWSVLLNVCVVVVY